MHIGSINNKHTSATYQHKQIIRMPRPKGLGVGSDQQPFKSRSTPNPHSSQGILACNQEVLLRCIFTGCACQTAVGKGSLPCELFCLHLFPELDCLINSVAERISVALAKREDVARLQMSRIIHLKETERRVVAGFRRHERHVVDIDLLQRLSFLLQCTE